MTEERIHWLRIMAVMAVVAIVIVAGYFVINKRNERNAMQIKSAASRVTCKVVPNSLPSYTMPGGYHCLGADFYINKSLTKVFNLVYAGLNGHIKRLTVMAQRSPSKDGKNLDNWKTKIVKAEDCPGSWEAVYMAGPSGALLNGYNEGDFKVEYGDFHLWNDPSSPEAKTPATGKTERK